MSSFLLILLVSIAAVAFLVAGLSLTLIFKGHDIQGEVGTNPNMKRLGLKCAAQELRDEERQLRGLPICDTLTDCTSCSTTCKS